jgi:hypothetical protein
LEVYLDDSFENIPIENQHTNLKYINFKIFDGGAIRLLWANTLSPFDINRQKWRLCEPLFICSSIGK